MASVSGSTGPLRGVGLPQGPGAGAPCDPRSQPRLHFCLWQSFPGCEPHTGHRVEGRRPQQGREGGRAGSRFKLQPCSPVTLGRSQPKAQGSQVGP